MPDAKRGHSGGEVAAELSLLLCSCIRNGVELLGRLAHRTGQFVTRPNCRGGTSLPLAIDARKKSIWRAIGFFAAVEPGALHCCNRAVTPKLIGDTQDMKARRRSNGLTIA